MPTPSSVANAYNSIASLANQAKPSQNEAATSVDFGSMVKSALEGVVEKGEQADQKALGLVQGQADVVDVVTAIAETEVAMEALVSVRDRVISAYQEILRMPI
ncbi:flagellar hook-basal body complex protein FliE [Stappia sp. F7233]|uniref:Flagellar hook-basal body complex protein FliE n=1 Tax=Stappia albiluteola TaxID=2758565 RepID=A0A839AHU2_9HYPH|nr:flagellar hook-basal body complex protein FliE [Stappia albiluteola]MBA5779291.1 flagellar hook-basal body complex protein FliE [Stappia albiluteola]